MARTRRSPEAARDNILAAAERVLIDQGPQALKLTDVAQAANVANATVLHHFGSIDGVATALMDRMVADLVARILAVPPAGDLAALRETHIQSLFDCFETQGTARLAAWLEMTGEWRRLTSVQAAVQEVVARNLSQAGLSPEAAEDVVLVAVVVALGVGLFGGPLATLMNRPRGQARALAEAMLRTHTQAAWDAAP